MDWGARAAWIYLNDQPDYAKLTRNRITVVYLDPRSTNAATVITDLRAHGLVAGIYTVPGWWGTSDPAAYAKTTSDLANRLIPRQRPAEAPPLMLDLEGVSKDWQAETVAAYRRYQPARPTAYTNAPFQDGTVVPTQTLVDAGLHWYVQLYYGNMSPCDPAAALLEVCRWAYPPTMVHPFYDGARVPGDWRDGCVFTLERMP